MTTEALLSSIASGDLEDAKAFLDDIMRDKAMTALDNFGLDDDEVDAQDSNEE